MLLMFYMLPLASHFLHYLDYLFYDPAVSVGKANFMDLRQTTE